MICHAHSVQAENENNKLNKVQQQREPMIIIRTLIVNYELTTTDCHMPHAIYESTRHRMASRFTDNSRLFAASATSAAVEDVTKERPPTAATLLNTHTYAYVLLKPNNYVCSKIPLLLFRCSHHCCKNARYNLDNLQTNLTTPTIADSGNNCCNIKPMITARRRVCNKLMIAPHLLV